MHSVLRVIVELGLPVAALSWLLFYRLYSRGELARDADRKSIRAGLKQIKQESKASKTPSDSFLQKKWMKFGGGFYGVAALWTLIVIEVGGAVSTIAHPSSIEDMFHGGPIDIIVNWVANQFSQFLQALLWFNWWSERGSSQAVWFVVALVGYTCGLELARYENAVGTRLVGWDWRAQLRARLGRVEDPKALTAHQSDDEDVPPAS